MENTQRKTLRKEEDTEQTYVSDRNRGETDGTSITGSKAQDNDSRLVPTK